MIQRIRRHFIYRQVQRQPHPPAQRRPQLPPLRQLLQQQQLHWPPIHIAIKSMLVIEPDMRRRLQAHVDRKNRFCFQFPYTLQSISELN